MFNKILTFLFIIVFLSLSFLIGYLLHFFIDIMSIEKIE